MQTPNLSHFFSPRATSASTPNLLALNSNANSKANHEHGGSGGNAASGGGGGGSGGGSAGGGGEAKYRVSAKNF